MPHARRWYLTTLQSTKLTDTLLLSALSTQGHKCLRSIVKDGWAPPSRTQVLNLAYSPGAAGQPLSAEQREKLVKQKEQYEKAAEKLEDQVGWKFKNAS